MTELLTVENLSVRVGAPSAEPIVDGVSLSLAEGEVLALVGESGSGKSLTAMSLARLLPRPLTVAAGTMVLDGVDLLAASEKRMNDIRGGHIGMLFQQPRRMLDPTSTVGLYGRGCLSRSKGEPRA